MRFLNDAPLRPSVGSLAAPLLGLLLVVTALWHLPARAQTLIVTLPEDDMLEAEHLAADDLDGVDDQLPEPNVQLARAELHDLLRLPGITREQAEAIAAWARHQRLPLPLEALAALPEIDAALTDRWRRHALDTDDPESSPAPSAAALPPGRSRGSLRLLTRHREGDGPIRMNSRLTWAARHWSVAATWRPTTAPDEPLAASPEALRDPRQVAVTLELRRLGPIQHLILGDYRLETGLGLVHGYPTLRGGLQTFLSHPSRFDRGLRKRLGTAHLDPSASHRGVAAAAALGKRTTLGTYLALETPVLASAVSHDPGQSSWAVRTNLGMWGAFVRWSLNEVTLGATLRASTHPRESLQIASADATASADRARQSWWGSVYGRVASGPWNAMGELALTGDRIGVGLGVVTLRVSQDLQIQATARWSSNAAPSSGGRGLTRSGQLVAGESGGALALRLQPLPSLRLVLAHDRYGLRPTSRHPWGRRGYQQLIQVTFEPRPWLQFRLDADSRTRTASARSEAGGLHAVRIAEESRSRRVRARLTYHYSERVRLQTRWHLRQHESDDGRATGSVLAQDVTIHVTPWLRVQGRLAAVEAPQYEARLYLYEADVPGLLSVPVHHGSGLRHYLVVRVRPLPGLSLDAKLATSAMAEPGAYTVGPAAPERQVHVHATYRF